MTELNEDNSELEQTVEPDVKTCRKCKSGVESTVWTEEDDKMLLKTLLAQKQAGNQSDNSFKPKAWQAAVDAVNASLTKGAVKDKASCKGHISLLCHID
jgi:Myb/SANT-like DNA-binding domain